MTLKQRYQQLEGDVRLGDRTGQLRDLKAAKTLNLGVAQAVGPRAGHWIVAASHQLQENDRPVAGSHRAGGFRAGVPTSTGG